DNQSSEITTPSEQTAREVSATTDETPETDLHPREHQEVEDQELENKELEKEAETKEDDDNSFGGGLL
ncbi:MAG: hypothetical protein K0U82_16695, partial [Planctomycetes bacterium]|nr:hypothetical protein [Planctomycetota bacterium]